MYKEIAPNISYVCVTDFYSKSNACNLYNDALYRNWNTRNCFI